MRQRDVTKAPGAPRGWRRERLLPKSLGGGGAGPRWHLRQDFRPPGLSENKLLFPEPSRGSLWLPREASASSQGFHLHPNPFHPSHVAPVGSSRLHGGPSPGCTRRDLGCLCSRPAPVSAPLASQCHPLLLHCRGAPPPPLSLDKQKKPTPCKFCLLLLRITGPSPT